MTISTELRHAFNFHRIQTDKYVIARRMITARTALEWARKDVAAKKARYTSSPWLKYCGNGARVDGKQWIESPAAMGLRFVGYCDKIRDSIGHTGWFTDAYQDSKIRGVVYQLPGRNGKARFVAAHDNEDNGAADNGGPAYVDFSTIYEESDCRSFGYPTYASDLDACRDAAYAADQFAEHEAEKEREYQTAWQAGQTYAETLAERAEVKAELRALLIERHQAKVELAAQGLGAMVAGGTLCAAIERRARDLIESMVECLAKAEKLASGDYGELYFYPGSEAIKAAFNDGAGQTVI